MRALLLTECNRHKIKGTILLAEEGINATIAGSKIGMGAILGYLREDPRLMDLKSRDSISSENPFYRMKVKLKKEIVTLGVPSVDPVKSVGKYVPPEQWNELISDPATLVVDTRNDYEVAIGSFVGALDPGTTNFREFPEFVEKNLDKSRYTKVAMFCTGGIRCEKATSFMLEQGFENVHHLKGGILSYLEKIPEEESLWQGECFVFDNRVAVNHELQEGSYDMCHACRRPLCAEDKQADSYQEGISCAYCLHEKSDLDRERYEQRQRQISNAKKKGQAHLGATKQDIEKQKRFKLQRRQAQNTR